MKDLIPVIVFFMIVALSILGKIKKLRRRRNQADQESGLLDILKKRIAESLTDGSQSDYDNDGGGRIRTGSRPAGSRILRRPGAGRG